MPRYHVNQESGEVGVCKARTKCPFGDMTNDHFEDKKSAVKANEERFAFFEEASDTIHRENVFTDQAIEAKLDYNGPIPLWFRDNKREETELRLFGVKSEIIDTIEIDGVKHAVVFEPNSLGRGDALITLERGYVCNRIVYKNFDTGEDAAYIKATYMTEDSLTKAYGSDSWKPWRYFTEMESFYGMDRIYPDRNSDEIILPEGIVQTHPLFTDSMDQDERLENKKKFVREARNFLFPRMTPKQYDELKDMKIESMNESDADDEIEKLNTIADEIFKQRTGYYMNKPYIDFSRVLDHQRGKGLGESLYVFSAKKLAQDGMYLRGSGVQSADALKAWKRMAANPKLPVDFINTAYFGSNGKQIQSNPVLDYRGAI